MMSRSNESLSDFIEMMKHSFKNAPISNTDLR